MTIDLQEYDKSIRYAKSILEKQYIKQLNMLDTQAVICELIYKRYPNVFGVYIEKFASYVDFVNVSKDIFTCNFYIREFLPCGNENVFSFNIACTREVASDGLAQEIFFYKLDSELKARGLI